jgi:hypothetical protein
VTKLKRAVAPGTEKTRLTRKLAMELDELSTRHHFNISRVRVLLSLHEQLTTRRSAKRTVYETDLLRAAVVLLHAMLEDHLRSIALYYLPEADESALNDVPLVGQSPSGRAEKFFLGRLARFRTWKVERLIKSSVESHLRRMTFNNTREIASLLRGVGIDPQPLSIYFSDLDAMMARRHQIVHRADLRSARTSRPQRLTRAQVAKWIHSTDRFGANAAVDMATSRIAAHVRSHNPHPHDSVSDGTTGSE